MSAKEYKAGLAKARGAQFWDKALRHFNPAMKLIKKPKGWVRADAVRVTRNKGRLLVEIRRKPKRRIRRNIAGYKDASGEFHPIRGGKGYSPKLAGDPVSRRKPKRSSKRKAKARKRGR